jgi:hypothetical protein
VWTELIPLLRGAVFRRWGGKYRRLKGRPYIRTIMEGYPFATTKQNLSSSAPAGYLLQRRTIKLSLAGEGVDEVDGCGLS